MGTIKFSASVAGTISFLLLAGGGNAEAKARKNVLFLMADDFNYWTGTNGYYPAAQTPNLDRLANKGVTFLQAYCSSPVCNPSRNALWSGYRPSTTGIDDNGAGYVREKPGFENIVSMHQYFMQQGYFTYGAGKLWHPGTMGKEHTDAENWTQLDRGGSGCNGGNVYRFNLKSKSNYGWSANPDPMNEENCADYKLVKNAARLIEGYKQSEHRKKPFFIACGVFRPHMPWNSPKSFWDEFRREDLTIPQGYNGESGNSVHREIVENDKWMEAIHAYLASCKLADYNVGVMLDALEKSPYAKNTIVVFMGDHGWHLGEKGHWGKFSLWDEANHTTLIIYDPSAKGNGQICKMVVSLQDIYPTLVEMAGLPEKSDIEGRSLVPLVQNPHRTDWNWPILMTYLGVDYIKTNQYRYVRNGDESMLSNVVKDPYEWNNLAADEKYKPVIENLSRQIDSMKAIGYNLKQSFLSANRENILDKFDNSDSNARRNYIRDGVMQNNELHFNLLYSNPLVLIEIFDESGKMVLSDYFPGEGELILAFDEQPAKGRYTARFTDEVSTRSESFLVN
jgi:arylsulfatase A-like enzyme